MTNKGIAFLMDELTAENCIPIDFINKCKDAETFEDMFKNAHEYIDKLTERLIDIEHDLEDIINTNDRKYFKKFAKYFGLQNESFDNVVNQPATIEGMDRDKPVDFTNWVVDDMNKMFKIINNIQGGKI